ncbi:cAMP-dependent protein kinase regulator [Klebsormidium nitens]|uniref:cAMP-dependent protein kinase regulator n=1 Tax=Klebsormidium nitens TaxID=105231 RepID=A0A1Y1HHV2_KLENI|nr:cAMP-dependent protein kinase regulator [Klebsormidium nitens]|eukprot:GAQ78044.1 cAMP-dependent protein kinase regulator [Klebsormidium nitens]
MDSAPGGPSGSGRETPGSGRQSPGTGRRRWGAAVGKVESMLAVSTALDLYAVQRQRRALRDTDPWVIVEKVRGLCQRRPPRPLSVVQDLVIHAGFLCGFIREQPLEAQFRLCQVVQFEDVGRGKLVCRQGEPGDRFYMIIHGCVSVQSLTAKRQVRNLGNLGRGDYFGDIALINGQARQATCITRSDTCLLTVGKEDFLELYKNRFSVRCVQAIKFLRKQVRPFFSISEPNLRLFAHYLCLLCFNPGTTWNVDDEGTVYFVRAGEAELLIPLPREDARFKIEGPYISVTRFKEGDYFGESSVFPEDRCGWLVRAVTPMQLFSVRGKDFLKHADPTVISMIRAESSFRVGYYAGRHSQPTPQLAERPSTSQLRLADAQRRRSRRSTPPPDGTEKVADGMKRLPGEDGTQKASDGMQKASNGTLKASEGTQKDGKLQPQSPEKSGVQDRGLAGGLTDRVKSVTSLSKGNVTALGNREKRSTSEGPPTAAGPTFNRPKRSDKKPETSGFGGNFGEAGARVPSAASVSGSTRGAKSLGDRVVGAESNGGGASRGTSRNETKAASARGETEPDAHGKRNGSSTRASASGEGAPAGALQGRVRGDKRPGPSAMKSPLGSRPAAAERHRQGSRARTGGLKVLDHLPEPSRRETPLGRALSEDFSRRPREQYEETGGISGRSDKGTRLLHNSGPPGEGGTLPRGNDVSGPHARWKDEATEEMREEVASGDERGPRSQAGSPDGAPRASGRRSRRRARWRVRARSALSSVEVSLETARRMREQELPKDLQFRGTPAQNGAGRRGGLGEAERKREEKARGAPSVRWEKEVDSDGEKDTSVGRSVAAADAEVSRRIAPKVVEMMTSLKRVEGQQGRTLDGGAILSPATTEEAKAAKASRLAQVYGPRMPGRRRSSSSAAAVRADESAVPGVGQNVKSRAQSVSVPKGQKLAMSPGSLSSQLRKQLHSLPLLHSPPGSPDHARGTFEATERFAGSPKEDFPVLPPVDLSDLPPVDLSDLPTPSEIVRMELGPEEKRSLDLVPLPLDALTLPWQAYTIPVASSKRWDGLQTEMKRKEKAKAAKLRRRTGLTEQQLKQSELQAVAHLRNRTVDLVGGRDLVS